MTFYRYLSGKEKEGGLSSVLKLQTFLYTADWYSKLYTLIYET